ncbi:MAG: PrsW family intramembrane metalloprotease [Candidatus Zixiibacteriota bacterium]
MILFYLILGIIPAGLWLYYFRKKDKYRPEAWKHLIVILIVGGFSVFFAALVEEFLHGMLGFGDSEFFLAILFEHTFLVGFVEEAIKFLVVWIFAYHSADFDEPVDGLIYSAAAAIGFATVENAFYAMKFGFANFLIRSFLSTLAHIMFAAVWGYELGRYKYEPSHHHKWIILVALLISSVSHGLFNTLLTKSYLWPLAIILIAIVMWRIVKEFYRKMLIITKIKIKREKIYIAKEEDL